MPENQELAVWVTVNGWKLEEFVVDPVDERTCRCYIASHTGSVRTFQPTLSSFATPNCAPFKNFAIKVQNDLDQDNVVFRIFLDGSLVHTQLCEPGDVRDVYGVSTHPWGVKNFFFENIPTTGA